MNNSFLVVCFLIVTGLFVLSVVIALVWQHFEEKTPQSKREFLIGGFIGFVLVLIGIVLFVHKMSTIPMR